jgi:hypothetical protein
VELGLKDVLTVAGATIVVVILTGAVKTAIPNFDSARFGALLAIGFGVAIVAGANATALADVRLDWASAALTGILAGASASGLYDAGKGLGSGSTKPVTDETTGGG